MKEFVKIFLLFVPIVYTMAVAEESKAQSQVWVTGQGEVILESNETRDEAIERALNKARKNAVIEVTGFKVNTSIIVMSSSSDPVTRAAEFSRVTVNAKIVKQEKPQIELIPVIVKNESFIKVIVSIKVLIEKDVKSDPSFVVSVKLNQENFNINDELIVTLRTSQDAFITILNFTEEGKIYALIPNTIMNNYFVIGNTDYQFPTEELRNRGFRLSLETTKGKNSSVESLLVIATKKEYPLLGLFSEDPANPFQYIGDLERLFEWKLQIPQDEIVEGILQQFVIYKF